MGISKVQNFQILKGTEEAEQRKTRRTAIEKKDCDLENQVVETKGNSESIVAEYENAKIELEKLYDYITDGIILRPKAHWYEEGEKNTKYFLSLEKNNKAKSHIRKVIDSNDEEITDQGNILKEIKCFYSNVYSRKSVKTEQDCLDYLKSINAPNLSETDKETCEGKLTKQSCWNALNSTKNGKSPGNDGLTKEFYTCFSGEITTSLVESLNHLFSVRSCQHHKGRQ